MLVNASWHTPKLKRWRSADEKGRQIWPWVAHKSKFWIKLDSFSCLRFLLEEGGKGDNEIKRNQKTAKTRRPHMRTTESRYPWYVWKSSPLFLDTTLFTLSVTVKTEVLKKEKIEKSYCLSFRKVWEIMTSCHRCVGSCYNPLAL